MKVFEQRKCKGLVYLISIDATIIFCYKNACITDITKTCPCNVYPFEPHFYIAKLGYAGVYLFFLFLLQNIDCGYSLEPPRRGGSNVYLQSLFRAKIRKISKFYT